MAKRALVVFLLASLLIPPIASPAEPADLALIREVLAALKAHHWNPHLDPPALIRAGVGGLRRTLRRAGVDASDIQEIPAGLDESRAIAAFGVRLDQAVQLGGGRIPRQEVFYAGVRAMVKAVGGSHTYFFDPAQRARLQDLSDPRVSGDIGSLLRVREGRPVIAGVLPGGPADRAGIRTGDVLLRVGGVAVADLDKEEIIPLIRGAPGTALQVTLQRGTRELSMSLVRDSLTWPVVESRMLAGGIGYVKLYGYPDDAAARIRAALTHLVADHPQALLVDLRADVGGYDREFLKVMSLFLKRGTVVFWDLGRDGIPQPGITEDDPLVPALPLAVLIDGGTFSSGELTAAALKEYGDAVLVGEGTAGALESVSNQPVMLSDGSALYVSEAQTLTGKRIPIEGRGYPPDIQVRVDSEGSRDPQQERAVQVLKLRLREGAARVDAARAGVGLLLVEHAGGTFPGTAFLVADHLVLTAAHLVDGARHIRLKFSAHPAVDAEVVKIDRNSDVAVLAIPRVAIRPLPLGEMVRAGQRITVIYVPGIGAPGAQLPILAGGIVSTIRPEGFLVQAPMEPSNGGGPVLDYRGEVVGVVQGTIGRDRQEAKFATPIGAALPLPDAPARLRR